MARVLAALFAAGGLLVAVTVALPHDPGTDDGALLAIAGAALVVAALLWRLAGRLDGGVLGAVLALGTVLVSLCIAAGGPSGAAYPMLFGWVALYGATFLSPSVALGQTVLAVVAYGAVLLAVDDVPVPAVQFVMVAGTVMVGGAMVSRLTAAIRAQAADAAAVAGMANRLGTVGELATQTCDGLRSATGADVVALLRALPDGAGLEVAAVAGTAESGMLLATDGARDALQRAFAGGEPVAVPAPPRPLGRLRGELAGMAHPVLRGAAPAGVLAVAWTTPRRGLSPRVESALLLFAAEAGVLLERAEALSREKERRALEINDNVVQGLVVARMAARAGNVDAAIAAIDETLDAARRLITDQLEDLGGGDLAAGLTRSRAASL
jgi:hypothetical protein